ncbi:MAG: AAA family ATPase [Rickettsiales bacterium]|jgi:DNA polymerase-3 subunit delta'|nr:AAA family ATPase [Rickettsiales bacterium]
MAPKKKESLIELPRPIDANAVVGHTAARRAFLDAWSERDSRGIHPAWILTGPKGIGKATLAYDLARKIFSDIFGRDVSEQMRQGGIGDLFVIDLEHQEDKARKSISVEAVRATIEKLQMSSMSESWRVVILDSIDELSAGTANALLKTLEEPPAKTIFFIVAHSLEKVLPTIRSRARVEKLRPLSPMELREIGMTILPGREISPELAKISGGSFGVVANLIATGADGLFARARAVVSSGASNAADFLALAKSFAAAPENMGVLLDLIHEIGAAELYPIAAREIERMTALHIDPETTAFKIITEIAKC